jgi:hypothetical protein
MGAGGFGGRLFFWGGCFRWEALRVGRGDLLGRGGSGSWGRVFGATAMQGGGFFFGCDNPANKSPLLSAPPPPFAQPPPLLSTPPIFAQTPPSAQHPTNFGGPRTTTFSSTHPKRLCVTLRPNHPTPLLTHPPPPTHPKKALRDIADDPAFQEEWRAVKQANKERAARKVGGREGGGGGRGAGTAGPRRRRPRRRRGRGKGRCFDRDPARLPVRSKPRTRPFDRKGPAPKYPPSLPPDTLPDDPQSTLPKPQFNLKP